MLGRVSDIDIRLLRVFISVVDAGGFSLASARLNVAESTISTHMSDLETRLGVRLCERGRSGFRVTKRGQDVYKETVALFNVLDDYRERIALIKTHVGGTARIGVADSLITNGELALSKWLRHINDQYPDMSVEIVMDTPRGLEQRLLEEELHCAIVPEHRRISGIEFCSLSAERNQLYCGRDHHLFGVPDEDITIEMIEAAGTIARGYIDRFDEDFFQPESHSAVVHQIEAAAMLILSGRYMGFLPVHYASSYEEKKELRAVKPDQIFLNIPFALAYKKSRQDNPFITSVIKDLKSGRLKTA